MPIGSIIGGILGQSGANAAAGAAREAGSQANQNALAEQDKLIRLASPWVETGKSAASVASMLNGLGQLIWHPETNSYQLSQTPEADRERAFKDYFRASPDYNFRLSEGLKALDRSAASKGMVLSGAQTKATQQYGGDLASGEYNNYYNKLIGMSNAGQGANATVSGQGAQLVNTGNQLQMQGNLAAANYGLQGSNALANGISSGISNLGNILAFGYGNGWFGGSGGGGTGTGGFNNPNLNWTTSLGSL